MKIGFITMYSPRYTSRVKVLIDSIKKYEPNSPIFEIKIEDQKSYTEGLAQTRLQAIKETLEKNTDIEALISIGADCELFAPVNEIREMLKTNSFVIVPHVINPLPDDNKSPSMNQLYTCGHANADIFAIKDNHQGMQIIDWLSKQEMGEDKLYGIFYEQTWLSTLPFVFDGVGILRHPGYNVGYWNIIERRILNFNKKYFMGNNYYTRLVIAHYSGFIKDSPKMSQYSSRHKELPEEVKAFYKRYSDLI